MFRVFLKSDPKNLMEHQDMATQRTQLWLDNIPDKHEDLEPHYDLDDAPLFPTTSLLVPPLSQPAVELDAAADNDDDKESIFSGARSVLPPDLEDFFDDTPLNIQWAILKSLTKLLKKHPLGVTPDKLVHVYKEKFGYYPDWGNFGYSTFLQFVLNYPDVFHVVWTQLEEYLVYAPDFIEKIFPSVEMFEKTWGNVMMLMEHNNYVIEVDKMGQMLTAMSGYRVDPSDWSFLNNLKFYKYCIKNLKNEEEPEIFLEWKDTDEKEAVLVQNIPSSEEAMKYVKKLEEKKKLYETQQKWFEMKRRHDRLLSEGLFVTRNHKVLYLSDRVKENVVILCYGAAIPSLQNFHVILFSYWNTLEKLMDKMQLEYKSLDNISTPFEGNLNPGFYVAAKCRPEREYHRAIITKRLDNDNYEVKLLDYGEIEVVPISDIRYLLVEFLQLPFLAIPCSASIIVDDKEIEWTQQERDLFLRNIFDKTLAIRFKKRCVVEGEKRWTVFVHTYDTQEDKVTALHVERQVLLESRGLRPTGEFETDDFQTLNIQKKTNS